MKKKLWFWLGILLLTISIVFCGCYHFVLATTTGAKVTDIHVHKSIGIYSGTEEGNALPICDAEFTAYDLTDEYYKQSLDQEEFAKKYRKLTISEALKETAEKKFPVVAPKGVERSGAAYTNQQGIASWTVNNEKKGKNAVYLILETGISNVQNAYEQMSQPMIVFMPVLDQNTQQELNSVDLYPKAIRYNGTPYFFKVGRRLDGTDVRLAGAQFVLSKQVNGTKQYWATNQPKNILNNAWQSSLSPSVDPAVKKFVSDENGLVTLGDYLLGVGTYYFEEIATLDGYQIDVEAKQIEVVVKRNSNPDGVNQILVKQVLLEKNPYGKVSAEAIRLGVPVVVNTQIQLPKVKNPEGNNSKGDVPKINSSETGKRLYNLPQTGEIKNSMLFFGVVILVICVLLWKKKEQ